MKQKMFTSMTTSCGKQEGASEEDVAGIIGLKPTNSHGSKCIQACLGEGAGVVSNFGSTNTSLPFFVFFKDHFLTFS